jgi:glycosyltransferase involved in cell wall biosynthesis
MNVGGTATYLASLIRGQIQVGNEVLLVTGVVPKGEDEDPVLQELPFKKISSMSREISLVKDFKSKDKLIRIVEDFNPDLIHTHTFKAGLLVRSLKMSIPVVHTFHGHHLYDPEFGPIKRFVLNLIERKLSGKSAALVTVGERVGEELLSKGIGKRGQFHSIPPGINPLKQVTEIGVLRRFGLTEDDVAVVWLGRFTRVKRPDLVIEVAKRLPKVTFLMAGEGELLDATKVAAPTNLYCLGIQSRDEMWAIADIALCTSDSEGMPLALIEAQMAGVAVVSTDVGSISEIVENGVTGELVSGSAEELSEVVKMLASSPLKLKEMSKAAESRAMILFSREVMVEKHQRLYEQVVEGMKK